MDLHVNLSVDFWFIVKKDVNFRKLCFLDGMVLHDEVVFFVAALS